MGAIKVRAYRESSGGIRVWNSTWRQSAKRIEEINGVTCRLTDASALASTYGC